MDTVKRRGRNWREMARVRVGGLPCSLDLTSIKVGARVVAVVAGSFGENKYLHDVCTESRCVEESPSYPQALLKAKIRLMMRCVSA